MTSECPLCNTQSVIEEEENGQVHHVCMECGHIVQERAILTTDAPVEVWAYYVYLSLYDRNRLKQVIRVSYQV